MIVRTSLALLLSLAAGSAALAAETTPERQALKRYCTGDYMTYCGNLSPDGPEVQACFKANKAKLSTECQGAIASYQKSQRNAQNTPAR